MMLNQTIKSDDDLLELMSEVIADDDIAFDVRVQVETYLKRCRQVIINDFEDFAWTDTNSGESNVYFEEDYSKYIAEITMKYI